MLKNALRRLGLYLVSSTEHRETPRPPPPSKQAFQRRGQRLLAARRNSSMKTTAAGSIQLLGMEEIKRELGAAWSELSSRASSIAEAVIREHLTNTDIYSQQDDGTFVLFFAERTKTEAEHVTRLIAAEMKAQIAEQIPQFSEALRVDHFAAEIDHDVIFDNAEERPLADVLLASLSGIRAEAEEAVRKRRTALLRDARVVFRPVWHPAKRAALLFRCMLDTASGGAAIDHFAAISNSAQLLSAISELDFLVFGKAIKSLHALLQRDAKAILLIPLNFHTAANKISREEYLRLCHSIPEPYKKFIFFEIHGSPAGTAGSRIAQISSALQPYCHAVVIETVGHHKDIADLAKVNVWGISLDISGASAEQHEFWGTMRRTVMLARAQNLMSIAHGANSIGQLQAAIEAGCDYINGEAVHISLDEPIGAFKFNPLTVSESITSRA